MEGKIVTESLESVLNLSLKQIKDEDLTVDVKEAIAGYLEPLLEKWRQDTIQENDKMSKLEKEQGSMCSNATVSIIKQDLIRNQTKDNVNVYREAGDVSKYEDEGAVNESNYKDREAGGEVSNCENIVSGDASKYTDREAFEASDYEYCYSPSTGLYCFQVTSKIKSYQFTVGDAGVITRVISPLVKDVIIMNKVSKLRRSTIQIGALVEGGVQQLEKAIDAANDALGKEKGFQFSPIDNRKDIFSVLGRKDEIPRVDANGVYQLQLKFKLDDIGKEDKARVAAEMGRRLERILDNVLVEKICRGPGERMLIFSHTSDIAAARRKLQGSQEFIVAPSKHVWKPIRVEVSVDSPEHVLKPDDVMVNDEEKKTVVSLLLANKEKNKVGPTFRKMTGVSDASKDVSCHDRRVNIIFKNANHAISFFQDVGKLKTKMWSHSVLISLDELGCELTPSITEEQMMRLAGHNKGEIFKSREKMAVSTDDGNVIFSFESVDALNSFIFVKSCDKKPVSSLGQLKRTSFKDDEFTLQADEDGFYTLQGNLDKFHAESLSELNFQDFKITSSSDCKKVYISFPNKMSMFQFLLSQASRQMGLLLDKKHFIKVNAALVTIREKSESVEAVKGLVQEIVEPALDGIDQIVRTPNDDKGSTGKEHEKSFGSGKIFLNSINQVQTEDKMTLFSSAEKESLSKNPHDVFNSSVKTDENGNRKEDNSSVKTDENGSRKEDIAVRTSEEDQNYQDANIELNKSVEIVQALIREILEQVGVGKELEALKCCDNLSHVNTDFDVNLKSGTSIDKNLTLLKKDFLKMTQESSDGDDSHDTGML